MAMHKMSSRPGGNGNGNGKCPHHWLIETAHGKYSDGVCLLCGEKREFVNWVPSLQLHHTSPLKDAKNGRRKNGGANSVAYIPVIREFEGGLY